MHTDLVEACQILELYKKGSLPEKSAIALADRICKFEEGDSKWAYYTDHKRECLAYLMEHAGYMKGRCSKNKCNECVINKWCNTYRIERQKETEQLKTPTFADFFCGAGGLSLGFTKAGFRLSLANDIQECCIDTLSFNHPDVPKRCIVAGDINEILDSIEERLRYQKVDVVIGGPPCQGFSMANRQRVIDDPRNHLYKSFVQAISILSPSFFVMENVRGMLSVKDQIIDDFEAIGYEVSVRCLNALYFGIPQNRERVIFIGNKVGVNNDDLFDELDEISKNTPRYMLKDALYGLNPLSARTVPNKTDIENDQSGYTFVRNTNTRINNYLKAINGDVKVPIIFNHKARYNNERDIEIFRRLNEGDDSSDPKIADIMPYKRREKIFKDKYFKLESNRPCKTITAHMKYDCNMYIHPQQARGLTPREAARVQSYPDNYFFRGTYTKTYMQVGNSVPPLLSECIARVIRKYL
ncbi:MAG: DNA cytosine methyltransferase [Eubacterium sp.]|nr:DNA cytosine methyltransferase [Eubacterium sp.]